MKKILCFLMFLTITAQLQAQTNAPVRLALISETDQAATAVDILTAQFSSNQKIQLLERDQIAKVYREQGLSKANTDYLKLGQILGADGLLLLQTTTEGTNQSLNVRLVAVKPGVVLLAEKFAWPVKDLTGWSAIFAGHLDVFMPKLTVLVKDAIPISVVNLRSAISSGEAAETERQLKLLTIQRLSREPQLFVLERQKMQLLAEEKELKLDDSAFWNGSYLLEGVVDQSGFSKDSITINARMTPPKGGAPVLIEASGSRTNLAEVVNQLAAKVSEALKINSTVKEWNTADEATQYFDEAKWALKWGVYSEAQAAANSAWVLGKHDIDSATTRVRAYADSTGRVIVEGSGIDMGIIDLSIMDSTNNSDRDLVIRYIKEIVESHPGAIFQMGVGGIYAVEVDNSPDSQSLDHAIRALDLYREFSQTLPPGEPKPKSAWYDLGVECLTTAAQVLQHYYLVPTSQGDKVDKLTELRALARSVATWIRMSPSVQDSYFTVDPNPDQEVRTLLYTPNIYTCELNWGCFWQEKPEDCIVLYRELLSSPAFSCLNEAFGSWPVSPAHSEPRGLDRPRLIAWNEEDRKGIPMVWGNFIQELNNSTNHFLHAEAKLFETLDATGLNETEVIAKYTNYWQEIISGKRDTLAIEAQKHFLTENGNWDDYRFDKVFSFREYTKPQALEIQPLLTTYKSNLVARMQTQSKLDRFGIVEVQMKLAERAIGGVQAKLDAVLGLPLVNSMETEMPGAVNHEFTNPSQPTMNSKTSTTSGEEATNYLSVKQFLSIPQEQLWVDVFVWPGEESSHGISNEKILTHCWREGKLLLGLEYYCTHLNQSGDGYAGRTLSAAALLNPLNGHWDVVVYPVGEDREYGSLELFHGNLYLVVDNQTILDGNQVGHNASILKYSLKIGQWETLNIQIPGTFKQTAINQGVLQLFVVNNHLYAANFESIFEITDDGHGTRILASTRRRPAVTALDSLDNLGSPVLFTLSDNSLRASIGTKIYSWDGKDWQETFDFGFGGWGTRSDIFEDGVLFRKARPEWEPYGHSDETLWVWQNDQSRPELCLYEKAIKGFPGAQKQRSDGQTPHPLWELPKGVSLINSGATLVKLNLIFFDDNANRKVGPSGQGMMVAEKDGNPARLVCFSRDCSELIVVPLKFAWQRGRPPLSKQLPWLAGDTWMRCSGNTLYIGQPDTPGIWAVPISEVEAAIDAQKQRLLDQKNQEKQAAEVGRKILLAKYDRNHNGLIDAEEREAALDDPAFIESELDVIDANHNGWLEAKELAWFDANTNKILEPKEQAGIEIAQHLLAQRLLKQFDANGDGLLDRQECNDLFQSSMESSIRSMPGMSGGPVPFPDENHDGLIDMGELESFLKQQTRSGLRSRGMPGMASFNQMRMDANQPGDPRQIFKAAVESYWQNPGGVTNRPPFNNRIPSGAGFVPSRIPQGVTQ